MIDLIQSETCLYRKYRSRITNFRIIIDDFDAPWDTWRHFEISRHNQFGTRRTQNSAHGDAGIIKIFFDISSCLRKLLQYRQVKLSFQTLSISVNKVSSIYYVSFVKNLSVYLVAVKLENSNSSSKRDKTATGTCIYMTLFKVNRTLEIGVCTYHLRIPVISKWIQYLLFI